ncbi:hypothetical protein AAY473_014997 [Plecturocebus cupreus]
MAPNTAISDTLASPGVLSPAAASHSRTARSHPDTCSSPILQVLFPGNGPSSDVIDSLVWSPALKPILECNGAISAYYNLRPPGSSDSPASAFQIAGITVEEGFHHIGQAGLELLTSVTLQARDLQPVTTHPDLNQPHYLLQEMHHPYPRPNCITISSQVLVLHPRRKRMR